MSVKEREREKESCYVLRDCVCVCMGNSMKEGEKVCASALKQREREREEGIDKIKRPKLVKLRSYNRLE